MSDPVSPEALLGLLRAAGFGAHVEGGGVIVGYTPRGADDSAELALQVSATSDGVRVAASFGVDLDEPGRIVDLLLLANDLNGALRVARAHVEPETGGGPAAATLHVTARLPHEALTAGTLASLVSAAGEDVHETLRRLVGA
ncbi:hypothetical protein [Deinococcus pimensis]|uniref:hypothetical protein n=1 Tax=Deinococcus pimensis TaxID=309888 RepID=UPI000483E95E|nr:hypothetical protein [Deinococcus pimensis]